VSINDVLVVDWRRVKELRGLVFARKANPSEGEALKRMKQAIAAIKLLRKQVIVEYVGFTVVRESKTVACMEPCSWLMLGRVAPAI
jgi:hypothetical protein